jgi:hypothetical protein
MNSEVNKKNESKSEFNENVKNTQENNKEKDEKSSEIKINKKQIIEKRISYFKLGLNSLLSIALTFFFLYIPHTYSKKWKMFFFMTLWSFAMNSYYIVSVTVIDWIRFAKKDSKACKCYNHFVRNLYLRICFPFAIAIVFLYWILILLGDDFEYLGKDVSDAAIGVFFHGMILIFLLFDIFTSIHKNIKLYFWDLLILTIMILVYFLILGIGKYIIKYDTYDFMEMSNVNQIIGACILIYIAILDGYVVLNLMANKFFEEDDSQRIQTYKDVSFSGDIQYIESQANTNTNLKTNNDNINEINKHFKINKSEKIFDISKIKNNYIIGNQDKERMSNIF